VPGDAGGAGVPAGGATGAYHRDGAHAGDDRAESAVDRDRAAGAATSAPADHPHRTKRDGRRAVRGSEMKVGRARMPGPPAGVASGMGLVKS